MKEFSTEGMADAARVILLTAELAEQVKVISPLSLYCMMATRVHGLTHGQFESILSILQKGGLIMVNNLQVCWLELEGN